MYHLVNVTYVLIKTRRTRINDKCRYSDLKWYRNWVFMVPTSKLISKNRSIQKESSYRDYRDRTVSLIIFLFKILTFNYWPIRGFPYAWQVISVTSSHKIRQFDRRLLPSFRLQFSWLCADKMLLPILPYEAFESKLDFKVFPRLFHLTVNRYLLSIGYELDRRVVHLRHIYTILSARSQTVFGYFLVHLIDSLDLQNVFESVRFGSCYLTEFSISKHRQIQQMPRVTY